MTRARALALASGLLLAAAGCEKGPTNDNSVPMTGGGGSFGHMASGTVAITIDTPAADPQARYAPGSLISVAAHVGVVDGTDYIDSTSVRVAVTEQGSSQVSETGQLVSASGDSYTGRVSLGDLKPGFYTLTVTARSSGGATGQATVDFAVDSGPSIVVNAPTQGGSYREMLTIEVVATDAVSGLMGAPTAMVGDIMVPLTDAGVPDTFRGTIDFDAREPALFGEQLLTVVAINNDGRRVEMQVIFTIDVDGPAITETRPAPGQMTGGIIEISAVIGDNAGLLESSIIAIIGDKTGTPLFEIPLKPRGAGVYGALFDTARLTRCPDPPATGPCIVFPTISFRASDQIGNERVVTYPFFVDNLGPVSDLDSANVRVIRDDGYCSREFDPLSKNGFVGDMPNDRAIVPQVFDLRARVEDGGNWAPGTKLSPISGLDPNATDVYVLNDETQPLVVDIDGDGTCDAINPKLIPTTQPPTQNNQVLKVRLAGVPKQGAPDFRMDSNPPDAAICTYPPMADPPKILCGFSQPYTTISYAGGAPAIWSIEPVDAAWCMGGQFDTRANNVDDDDWACIAVQSADRNGNVSVSPPLRVYVRYDGNGAGPRTTGPGTPPACTGRYDKATDTVTPGTCTTRRFNTVEYCLNGDC